MSNENDNITEDTECIDPSHLIPASELSQYSVDRDPHCEQDISDYVSGQAPDEEILHVEKIKQEIVLGDLYEIWDVTTDKDRWWVITNLTNLYSQKHFPSLDYTLSFHVGLMMRLRSRPDSADSMDSDPFDEVYRRQEQAKERFDRAIESEDFQAVGMQLRECLISLVGAIRRRVQLQSNIERPQDSNVIDWSDILVSGLCSGSSNKVLRKHLKVTAKEAWQLVNWLTHDRKANKTASSIAIHACDTVVGNFIQILVRERIDKTEQCPLCKSREIRSHFDISIEPEGDYFATCGVCDWSNHPHQA